MTDPVDYLSTVSDPTPVEETPGVTETVPDTSPKTPPICDVCGEVIVREPGKRGRTPKYHPECRPLASTASGTGKRRTSASTKAERESEQIHKMWTGGVAKVAILTSLIDQYDGMAIMVGGQEMGTHIPGIMVRHDNWRQEILAMQEGGSVVGFAIAFILTLLPILAHHGIIPNKAVRGILEETPRMMLKLRQRLETAEDAGAELLVEFAKKDAEARQRAEKLANANGQQNHSEVPPTAWGTST